MSEDWTKEQKLEWAIYISLSFVVVELVGGFYARSLAILSDAAHLLSDIMGFGISLFAVKMANWGSNSTHSFGYKRGEVVGAMFSVILIWAVTLYLIVEAIERMYNWFNGDIKPIDGALMSGVALFGIVANLCVAYIFWDKHSDFSFHSHDHEHSHGHDHGHDHGHEMQEGTNVMHANTNAANNGYQTIEDDYEAAHIPGVPVRAPTVDMNIEAAFLHVITDLITGVGVLIAGLLIWWDPAFVWVDPLCTMAFAAMVMKSTKGIIKKIMLVLFEGVPEGVDYHNVRSDLRDIDGIGDVHHLHIWAVSSDTNCLACHLSLNDSENGGDTDLLARHNETLRLAQRVCIKHNIQNMTIQIEDSAAGCSTHDCNDDCAAPASPDRH
eukprot:GSChrysophyteH2.ASY1.ANO1.1078.1 assembled CDS